MNLKVLAFGEVLWDIYEDSEHIGGASLNFAAHFKKCGGEAWLVTAVGNDLLGKKAVEVIEKMGINTEYVTYSDCETGKCLVTLDDNQIPTYNLLNNVAYDYIQNPKLMQDYDVLYFGTLALRTENNRNVLKQIISENKFGDIFADMNIRAPYYCEEVIRFVCENATTLKISDEELPIVMGVIEKAECTVEQSAKVLGKKFGNLKMVIITKGEKGSFIYDFINNKSYEYPAEKVEVVSTVGAGDSFSASFLAKYLKTKDISCALKLATKISAYVVSRKEAVPDYKLETE